jgi:hypothetical protein
MANPKLYGEFRSDYGNFYLIEIWDEDYTGNDPDRFNVTGDGFELNYSGQTDNVFSPIIGSSVSFGMYVQNSATNTFLTNLKQQQENRYYVKIWKGQFNGEDANTWYNTTKVSDDGLVMSFSPDEEQMVYLDFYWGGYITQDVIEIEDVSQPYILNIQATDGIAKLKNTTVTTSYFRQFTNQFINALDAANVLGIYGSEHSVLAVVCNWWASEMTYNANNNPLDETWADFRVFDTIDEDGVLTGRNWYDVLSQMCYLFGLRFYYSNGQYRLEQLFLRDSVSMIEHRYKKDKTKIDSESVSYEKTINQTSNKARLSGNVFNFLPAVKDVTVVLNKQPKAIIGVRSTDTTQPVTQLGFVASTPDNQITVSFKHAASIDVNTQISQTNKFMKLRLNMEIFDFNNNVTYYLKRTYTGMTASTTSWTTTQAGSGYEVLLGPMDEYTVGLNYVTGNTTIVTPKTPADGDVEYDWEFVEFVNTVGATYTLNAANSYGWVMETSNLITTNGQGITNQTNRVRAVSPNANIKSNLSYELPEMNLLTGNGERGSLVEQTTVGSIDIRIPYGNWREGNAGSYKQIQKLVTQEFLKLMDEPIEKYMGAIFSSHDFRQRLYFDGSYWIQLGGRFTANTDEWDGEWFVIRRASITPTFDDINTVVAVTAVENASGLTGNVSFEGIDAVNADLNSVDVTTNANVGGNVDITGNTDVTGALDVAGNSTLSATSVGEFTTTGRVNVTLNEVTGNPGGSETLSTDKNFNFIDFEGGENGTYTLNLPPSEAGLIMRFKTNDTISNSKDISLVPQSGERIDGEDSYSMDRPYDGITLMGGPSGDWFVIQKKEK